MRFIRSFMLLFLLVTLEACISPLYKPLSPIGLFGHDRQGYFEYKIDDRTYLIGYSNYISAPPIVLGDWHARNMTSFLKGAREYAFYRAAEFTKSKGWQSFIVLHKDDWLYTGSVPASGGGKYGTPRHLRASPGAWVIIRFGDPIAVALHHNGGRIYSVDGVLESLSQENSGLPAYQGASSSPRQESQPNHRSLQRWRSSSSSYDSVRLPASHSHESWPWKYDLVEPGSNVVQTAPGKFTIAVWDEAQVSPMQVLWQCVALANREGYKAFKIEKWTIEEHSGGAQGPHRVRIWFRDMVDIVLQHQKEPNSLESVFEVDEVLSYMDANGAPLPR